MKFTERAKKIWFFVEEYFLVLLIVIMGVDILLQVISRKVFSHPVSFSEELARYLQIWITFLGAGLCFRRGEMIRATFVYDKMPQMVKYLMDLFAYLFMLWVSFMMIAPSWELVLDQSIIKWDTIRALNLGSVYICEPIGFILIGIYIVVNLVKLLREMAEYVRKGEKS